jgi:hypothetical protein
MSGLNKSIPLNHKTGRENKSKIDHDIEVTAFRNIKRPERKTDGTDTQKARKPRTDRAK